MLGRFISLVGVSVLCVAACGGGAFSSANDGEGEGGDSSSGSGGKAAGTGGKTTAGKGSGGNQTQGGSSSQGGDTGSGGVSSGGKAGVGGMHGGSGGSVVAVDCEDADDCPTSNSCHDPTCEDGVCGEVQVPDGPFRLQVPGDCSRMDCEGGEEKLVVDPNDSNDNNECTVDSCSPNGTPTHNARLGEVCSNGGGICNGEGQCALCDRSLCPVATACLLPICDNGTCQQTPRPAGHLCPLVSPNDPSDQYGQCDGSGVCVDCVNSGGCGECCGCTLERKCVPI